ncbi:hypothetical protein CRG98_013822 [Punica granatum]|uniref:Uncharacterized protein n=1 Tax=Punica granatum TaxID=22663 RepID=A0A2I0KC49_PUNGR|nr:hypothetical protein CRG98_013822 [Punica granatum]
MANLVVAESSDRKERCSTTRFREFLVHLGGKGNRERRPMREHVKRLRVGAASNVSTSDRSHPCVFPRSPLAPPTASFPRGIFSSSVAGLTSVCAFPRTLSRGEILYFFTVPFIFPQLEPPPDGKTKKKVENFELFDFPELPRRAIGLASV